MATSSSQSPDPRPVAQPAAAQQLPSAQAPPLEATATEKVEPGESSAPIDASAAETTGPWYKDGLKFKCTGCGNCCTGFEGFVWVNAEEVQAIANFLGKSIGEVRIEHTRLVGRRTTLREFANHDCTFFDSQTRGCKIYPVRPRQCRTWPFWESNLESPETWEEVKQGCPGAGKGNFFPLEEIEKQAAVIKL